MSLKVQVRREVGVAVLRCDGTIVSGTEAEQLEQRAKFELNEGTRYLVLDMASVTRVDSSGLGLMVRLLTRARKAGGDVKVSSPPDFLTNLLQMTRLLTLFHVFPSEQQAVMSYRKPAPEVPKAGERKARIIFLDRSADVCAFVRTLLIAHGYDVLSTTFMGEARILLRAGKTDFFMLGPNMAGADSPAASLAATARNTTILELGKEFETMDAERAGQVLLQLLEEKMKAGASGSA